MVSQRPGGHGVTGATGGDGPASVTEGAMSITVHRRRNVGPPLKGTKC